MTFILVTVRLYSPTLGVFFLGPCGWVRILFCGVGAVLSARWALSPLINRVLYPL